MGAADFARNSTSIRENNAAIRRGLQSRWAGGRAIARILVMDDDPLARKLLERALERAGHFVIATGSGSEALEALASDHEIALLITDLDMREVDGLHVILTLRKRQQALPILAISARSSAEGWQELAAALGANSTLPKPFDLDRLVEIVRQLVKV